MGQRWKYGGQQDSINGDNFEFGVMLAKTGCWQRGDKKLVNAGKRGAVLRLPPETLTVMDYWQWKDSMEVVERDKQKIPWVGIVAE